MKKMKKMKKTVFVFWLAVFGFSAGIGFAQSFPDDFQGTWKRSQYASTLTFTGNTVKASNRDVVWTLRSVTGNKYAIVSSSKGVVLSLTVRLVNGKLEISGDSGSGEGNWNGAYTNIQPAIPTVTVNSQEGSTEATNTQGESAVVARTVTRDSTVPDNFAWIESGTFTMGSPVSEPQRGDYEGPQRQVTESAFYIGKYQVTQREYEELMGVNPSSFIGSDLPVERVTWFDAVEYCNKRSQQEKLTPAYTISGTGNERSVIWNQDANGYRLPTEAEWEYACRAGTTTPFSTGNNITTDQANYDGNYPYNTNTKGRWLARTSYVGSFPANAWGLYNMHGNVFEWCWDWYGIYASGSQTDPAGADTGSYRVLRGGSWYDNGRYIRSANRNSSPPALRSHSVGFRLVRS
jgi:formylglycine-generating enzyme required for sulfatase activity